MECSVSFCIHFIPGFCIRFILEPVYVLHAKPIVEVHAIPIRIEWTITAYPEYHQPEWIKITDKAWWNQIKAFWKVIQVWQWQSGKDEDTCRCWCKIEKSLFPSMLFTGYRIHERAKQTFFHFCGKHISDQWMNRNYVGSKGNIGILKQYWNHSKLDQIYIDNRITIVWQ